MPLHSKKRFLYRGMVLLLSLLCLSGSVPISTRAQAPVYRSVKNEACRIALTFDDGPHPYQTKQILDILERYQVSATFFMVGVNVENYPDAARAVIEAGHEVGNHTYSHRHFYRVSSLEIQKEIGKCEDTLEELCEYRPHLFRPPEGALNACVESCSENNDYSLILWSLDTRDWETKNAEKIVETVLSSVQPGDIILMHDYIGVNSQTPQALEILLPKLLQKGFEPVTVSQLLGLQ